MMIDNVSRRKVMMRAVFKMFPKRAARFTVKNVVWWLEKLKVEGDSVAVPALCAEGVDLTDPLDYGANLRRVWELKRELIMGCKAQDVSARWMGGPPTDIKRYTGTFLQLLMDRILMDVYCHGTVNFVRINREWRAELSENRVQLYPFPATIYSSATTTTTMPDDITMSSGYLGGTAEWAR